jgi:hypothetical protein
MKMAAQTKKTTLREYLDKWAREVSAIRKAVCLIQVLPRDRQNLHRIASSIASLCEETSRLGFPDLYEESLKAECFVFDADLETAPGAIIATRPILASLDSLRTKIMVSDEEVCWREAHPLVSRDGLSASLDTSGLA